MVLDSRDEEDEERRKAERLAEITIDVFVGEFTEKEGMGLTEEEVGGIVEKITDRIVEEDLV